MVIVSAVIMQHNIPPFILALSFSEEWCCCGSIVTLHHFCVRRDRHKICFMSNMVVPIFSLSFFVYKKIRRKPYCWPLWVYLLDTERLEMSIYAVSWGSDDISSLTVMVLSANGINWPTSAQLHNPLPSIGSLLQHHLNVCVCPCWTWGGCIQSELSGLSYLCYLSETLVPLLVDGRLISSVAAARS